MPIELGDAMLRFIADSQQLDLRLDEVGPKAKAGFEPAAEAVDEFGDAAESAGQRTAASMREARGEVALLGEEFGVRLPRHVRNFVAELPGVGEAMSAAFSATAIFFVANAIVELTKKASDFVANMFIFTEAMKQSTAGVVVSNTELLKQKEIYQQAEDALQAFGKTAQEVATEKVATLNDEIEKQSAILRQAQDNLYGYRHDNLNAFTAQQAADFENTVNVAQHTIDALKAQRDKAQLDEVVALGEHQQKVIALKKQNGESLLALEEQIAKTAVAGTENAELKKYAIEDEYTNKRYQLERNSLFQTRSIEQQLQRVDDVAKLNADLDKLDKEHTQHYQAEIEKQKDAFAKAMAEIATDALKVKPEDIEIVTPKAAQSLLQYEVAAQKLGITLKSNLVSALATARAAFDALKQSGHALPQELKEAHDRIDELQKSLTNFGKTEDSFLSKSHAWKNFQEQIAGAQHGIDQLKLTGVQAFDSLETNISGAFQAIVMGQQGVGRALEQATASSLAQIASQAAVKALFYTGEGFAMMAGFMPGQASEYFEAAGIMAAVAVAAGAAGRGLSDAGGGGGSGTTEQLHNSRSNTTSSGGAGTTVSGIQGFAEGGLITAPVLATIGEGFRREAVVPLEDPTAMRAIAEAINNGGGGGTHFHVNVEGLISPDNLTKVMKQMSDKVNRGQATLKASDSLRVTKRSA